MNKKDRHLICSLIAEWEWNSMPGTSEAGGIARCGQRLQQEFQIPNDELAFYRAWEITHRVMENTSRAYDDLFFDALLVEVEKDLDTLVDQLESMGWGEFAAYIDTLKDD